MSQSTAAGQSRSFDAEPVKEAERRRIARDLHDELGSHLTALKMALAQLNQQLPHDAALQEQARYADQLIDGAIDAMHDIIDDLHPAVLDLGLPAALEWLAKTFAAQTGTPHRITGDHDIPAASLDPFQTVSLYRIAREALHNASRHAAAGDVEIHLHHAGNQLELDIIDNGVGLSPGAGEEATSSGMRGMRQRAAALGGSLEFQSVAGRGVKVRVRVPTFSSPDHAAANLIK